MKNTWFKQTRGTVFKAVRPLAFVALASGLLTACSGPASEEPLSVAPSSFTSDRLKEASSDSLKPSIARNLELARKGFIAAPSGKVLNGAGQTVWDFEEFKFVEGPAPETVNPNLWEQARLNNQVGLFEVKPGIYQLRGFDLSNMTLIQGQKGWIVVDPLTSQETAKVALDFAFQHLKPQPVTAIVYTHSHVDHFGGALGILSAEEAREFSVPVVAPEGFVEEATSENILVGPAMGRRSVLMYGRNLPRTAQGLIDNGLGKAVAYGTIGLLEPNRIVRGEGETIELDGVTFQFRNVPDTEAPSEFVFYLPDFKAFGGAELFGHTLHNLYTLRGAKVRDALQWVNQMTAVMDTFTEAEVLFTQHNWPVWGQENIQRFMRGQRDTYKFIHDQTVRLFNAGYTPDEIAEMLDLPEALANEMSNRGFYGTVSHNVKAVYQFYLGWYDAHPSSLHMIPPEESAKRYVALAGGMSNLLDAAQDAYDEGEYRWAAELLKHAVFADPDHAEAKELLAATFEQMGYVAESGPWRNVYLSGARELRRGEPDQGINRRAVLGLLKQTPIERFLEAMAASVNPEKAADKDLKIELVFSDTNTVYQLHLKNSVMNFWQGRRGDDPQASLELTKDFFLEMVIGEAGGLDLLLSSDTDIDGSLLDLRAFFASLDKAEGKFAIVTP